MKAADEENLRGLLDWIGLSLVMAERDDTITISQEAAGSIAAILSSLSAGKVGRPKRWSFEIESLALYGLLKGTPVNVLAREIAEQTGQPESSARRRLQELKNSSRVKNWRRR